MSAALKMLAGGLPTVIDKYPNGRYGIIGRIPYALSVLQTTGTPQIPPARCSMTWATEQEVIDALLAIDVTRFQRADHTWYRSEPMTTTEGTMSTTIRIGPNGRYSILSVHLNAGWRYLIYDRAIHNYILDEYAGHATVEAAQHALRSAWRMK